MVTPASSVIDDVGAPRTQARKPYTVFSAFHRSWEKEARRDVLGAPRRLPALPSGLATGEIPTLASLGLEQEVDEPPKGGEREGRKRLERFLARDVVGYGENRDALCSDSTSRLSPYLHFGCVSAREVEHRLGPTAGPPPSAGSSAGATSTTTCCSISPATPPPSSSRATAERSSGVTPSGGSWRGVRGAPGTRSSTRACASCSAKAGCTTARDWWWGHS